MKKQPKRSIDLSFLLEPPKQRVGWTDQKIRKFVAMMKQKRSNDAITKEIKLGDASQKIMRRELIEAAKAGMCLKDYLNKGRPFKKGAKILAK